MLEASFPDLFTASVDPLGSVAQSFDSHLMRDTWASTFWRGLRLNEMEQLVALLLFLYDYTL